MPSILLSEGYLLICDKKSFYLDERNPHLKLNKSFIKLNKIAYVRAENFRPSKNFSADTVRASAQLLSPWCILLCNISLLAGW